MLDENCPFRQPPDALVQRKPIFPMENPGRLLWAPAGDPARLVGESPRELPLCSRGSEGQLVDLDRLVDGVVTYGRQSLPHPSLRLLGVLGLKVR